MLGAERSEIYSRSFTAQGGAIYLVSEATFYHHCHGGGDTGREGERGRRHRQGERKGETLAGRETGGGDAGREGERGRRPRHRERRGRHRHR